MTAASLVERATNDLLLGPDWALNLDICDMINNDPGQAKDVIKQLKKRITNKNAAIQILALTVFETLVKNCGDSVHQQIAEKDVLHEMVKIVKKKSDLRVREKILELLDAWQEAFGGQKGRYPQYYVAYDELRRAGVDFPERASEPSVPIFTPPCQPTPPVIGYPVGSESDLVTPTAPGGAVAPETTPGMSLTDIATAHSMIEILTDMLSALDPQDGAAVKGEVISELVDQCRTNQRYVMALVNTTSDEALLGQGLELNDDLQRVLAKHDAIASGSQSPPQPVAVTLPRFDHEDDEPEDDFAQLAHRSSSRSRLQAQRNNTPAAAAGIGPSAGLPIGPPLTLPPPPQSNKKVGPASRYAEKHEQTVDLLSGELYGDDASGQSSATTAHTVIPPSERVQGGFVETVQSFHTMPSTPVLSPAAQRQLYGHSNGSPVSPSSQQEQNTQGQVSSPLQSTQDYLSAPFSRASPAAGKTHSPLQSSLVYGDPQSPTKQQESQGQPRESYRALSPSGGFNGMHAKSAQQHAMVGRAGSPSNPAPVLPPPPGKHTQRQQFFQQQQQQQGGQSLSRASSGGSTELGNSGVMGGSPQAASPTKEGNQSDRLFEDLVDLRSTNASSRRKGIFSNVSRSSKS